MSGPQTAGEVADLGKGKADQAISPVHVIGLDLSLTSTGVAGIHGDDYWTDRIRSKELRGHRRLNYLLTGIRDFTRGADLVVIEGLAFDGHDTNRGNAGLSWLVRHQLWRAGRTYALVPPSNRCQYATGKGRADKKVVVKAVQHTYGALVVQNDDEADALVLAAMGARWMGQPIDALIIQRQLDAMDTVAWPERVSP